MCSILITAFSWKLPTALQNIGSDQSPLHQIVALLDKTHSTENFVNVQNHVNDNTPTVNCVLNVGSILDTGECTCNNFPPRTDPPHGEQRFPCLFAGCSSIFKGIWEVANENKSITDSRIQEDLTLPNSLQSICLTSEHVPNKYFVCNIFKKCTVLPLDAYLAYEVFKELTVSRTFSKSFRFYASHYGETVESKPIKEDTLVDREFRTVVTLPGLILVRNVAPGKEILDYKWNYRVCGLVHKKVQLEDAMNWLNTLGGGYSALGEYLLTHAEEAGRIAGKQLNIAQEMGNMPVVIRCHLYFALSRMQVGDLHAAKFIIRYAYKEIKSLPINDRSLYAISEALWNRLKYLCKIRHLRNVLFPGNNFDIS